MLAGALGDELLDPEAEARRPGRRRRTSACRGRGARARRARARARGPGLVVGRVEVRACLLGRRGALEQRVDRRADQRRRHEPEQRQRRVAPADVRVVLERTRGSRARAPARASELPGSVIAMKWLPVGHERVEVLEQRQRLDRPAGLRRDDEQRAARGRSPPGRRGSPPGRSSRARAGRARPAVAPKVRQSTSGARLEPPMPSSTASVKPSAARRARTRRARRRARASRRRSSASRGGRRSRAPRAAPQRLVLGPHAAGDALLRRAVVTRARSRARELRRVIARRSPADGR